MANYQIEMVKGDTLSFGLEFDGLNQELSSMTMTCRKIALDENIAFQKTIGDGISMPEENHYVVRVAPEDTENLDAGNYQFDLEIRVNGDVFTIMIGIIVLEQDVTY